MDRGTPHDAVDLGVGGSVANRSVQRACRLLSAFTIEQPLLKLGRTVPSLPRVGFRQRLGGVSQAAT